DRHRGPSGQLACDRAALLEGPLLRGSRAAAVRADPRRRRHHRSLADQACGVPRARGGARGARLPLHGTGRGARPGGGPPAALGLKGYLGTIFFLPEGLPTLLKPVMLVIMTPIEIIGKLAKPFALAVRLFANMTAGHVVVLALIGLTFFFQSYLVGVAASVMA